MVGFIKIYNFFSWKVVEKNPLFEICEVFSLKMINFCIQEFRVLKLFLKRTYVMILLSLLILKVETYSHEEKLFCALNIYVAYSDIWNVLID